MATRKRHWVRLGVETLVLIVIGGAAGFLLNKVREERLAFDLNESQLLIESGAQIVTPAKAHKLFAKGEYIFVDARDTGAYLAGHIEGAFSLPTARFDDLYAELSLWTGGQPILVYGDGAKVMIVDDLARRLREMGEEEIAIMVAGFEGWMRRNYSVETGGEGLLAPEDVE